MRKTLIPLTGITVKKLLMERKELGMSDSIGSKEFATKFGCRQAKVTEWCRKGMIPGANQDSPGSPWHIPKDAVPPITEKRGRISR